MHLEASHVLLIPGTEPTTGAIAPPGRRPPAPRLSLALSWMLNHLQANATGFTVGLGAASIAQWPDLAWRVVDAGGELAVAGDDHGDPWALPAGALRDLVEQTIVAATALGLPAPTTFLPPRPDDRLLDPAQALALREAGITLLAGCRAPDQPGVGLATFAGRPLTGWALRLLPVGAIRLALAKQAGKALVVAPADIDPGAPGFVPGRTRAMQRFPRLLHRGFLTAAEAARRFGPTGAGNPP